MLDSIETALAALAQGKMIVVVDDENRENEGDLIIDAAFANQEAINFMARFGRGLICLPLEEERLASLGLGPMTAKNGDAQGTAFTVSVDHRDCTTGISAGERALTVQALIDPNARPGDFRAPGHLFPLAARKGGVLVRRGHTEAAVDLSRLARQYAQDRDASPDAGIPGSRIPPNTALGGVICEIMNEDGTMARLPELRQFAKTHGLPLISIEDLVAWRREKEPLVRLEAETVLPTHRGTFRLYAFTEIHTGKEHIALTMGDLSGTVLGRVHSECLTGDALGSRRCDCGEQYEEALKRISQEGRGVLVYLRQEGRGIGLVHKLKAYALQDGGMDTLEANLHLGFKADERDYAVGASILKHLGVSALRLMTNNPEKVEGLRRCGIAVETREPIIIPPNPHNQRYLAVKAQKMRHALQGDDK